MTQFKSKSWQTSLIQMITDPKELFDLLELDMSLLAAAYKATQVFPLKVPRSYVDKITKGDINDPLLRQILPLGAELQIITGYIEDPLNESSSNPIPGLLHKYHGRVLLTLTGNCGINCRYCFRRHFPYEQNNPGTAGWEKALNYIADDPSIHEVILSGGDPLVVSDNLLQNFSRKLSSIPHIKRLRIHSRLPIVMPERITSDFIDWITNLPFKVILVTHANHPREISTEVNLAFQAFSKTAITLLNQTVLLKGVNDSVETLVELSESLFTTGILPYYLHVLDKVEGAAHFDIPREIALALHQGLSHKLSGFLVPKLVSEQIGYPAKQPVLDFDFYTG